MWFGPSVHGLCRDRAKYREWLKMGTLGCTRSKYNWSLPQEGIRDQRRRFELENDKRTGGPGVALITYRSARIKSSTKVLRGGDGGVGGNLKVEKLRGPDVGVRGGTWTCISPSQIDEV